MGDARREWARSWWIALTFVPLGVLAWLAFAIAGLRARRRDWIGWAAGYAVFFWGVAVAFTAVDPFDRWDPAGGIVLLVASPVPIVHAFAIRRTYLEATKKEPRSRAGEDPAARRRRVRRRASGTGAAGAVLLAAGVLAVTRGEPGGLAGIAAGLGFLVASPPWTPVTRRPFTGPVEGSPEAGLVFGFPMAARRGVAMAFFALAGIAAALWLVSDPFDRILAGGASVLAVPLVVRGLRHPERADLALTARGVHNGRGSNPVFVPWDAIESIYLLELQRGNPLVALTVADHSKVETSSLGRFLMRLGRQTYGDLNYSPRAFDVELEGFVGVFLHYWRHPEERRDLGTHRAVALYDELVAAGPLVPAED